MSTDPKRPRYPVLLPQTAFPMKAELPKREPEILELWRLEDVYGRIREKRKGREKFILHDGPPYANGRIHIGHAFNKILKDMIVKYKTMRGFDAPYVPGWDCHGLPIEHALLKEMGKRKEEAPQVEFRKKARAYAEQFVSIQREEFIRLGVFGGWDKPYLTMSPVYQAKIAECFLTLYERGFIEKRLKPVPWCYECETALADAELEYEDKTSPSVFVLFKDARPGEGKIKPEWLNEPFSFLAWTTTPWTLPANTALAFHPELDYAAVRTSKGNFIFAEALLEPIESKLAFARLERVAVLKGATLEGWQARHPFLDRNSVSVLAGFVSSTEGTGIVHIAPGHGEEDYEAGLRYRLPILSPVDEKGRFTKDFPEAEGVLVHKANRQVIELMKQNAALLHDEPYQHSYPHCWRCKNPIIFRATKQWFLKVDHEGLRRKLSEAIQSKVNFTPEWGKNRIGSMVDTRPDWCLSRQRYWGVPIPIIFCKRCGEVPISQFKDKVVSMIASGSADIWFERPASDFLPGGFRCPCGEAEFEKDSDIIDVWFDSGVSHQAVLKGSEPLSYPCDLYLEGSDQHRGWFQTALITGVALDGAAPFKGVLTHGFVVDGEGKKMSKSLGNVVSPQEVIAAFGADVLRLWAAASDYQFDIRLSQEILNRLVEGYRRIRNTFRFLLGNLHDFDYKKDRIPFEKMLPVDRWALGKCMKLVSAVTGYYDRCLFHQAYRLIQDYLVIDLSSFYLDLLKDRLYTAPRASEKRRSAQTALYFLLRNLVKVLAPALPFTCEEVWRSQTIEHGVRSVHEADWPGEHPELIDEPLLSDWEDLLAVRAVVNQKLEARREAKEIKSSLEAKLVFQTKDERLAALFQKYGADIREAFIVSQVEIREDLAGDSNSVVLPSDSSSHTFQARVENASGRKCERCWNYSLQVGSVKAHATLCERCVEAV